MSAPDSNQAAATAHPKHWLLPLELALIRWSAGCAEGAGGKAATRDDQPARRERKMNMDQLIISISKPPLEAGLKYMLTHSRFGRATVKVTRVDETWADCEVLSGTMRGMGRGAVWGPGDTKTVRIEHGVWTLVPLTPP